MGVGVEAGFAGAADEGEAGVAGGAGSVGGIGAGLTGRVAGDGFSSDDTETDCGLKALELVVASEGAGVASGGAGVVVPILAFRSFSAVAC